MLVQSFCDKAGIQCNFGVIQCNFGVMHLLFLQLSCRNNKYHNVYDTLFNSARHVSKMRSLQRMDAETINITHWVTLLDTL